MLIYWYVILTWLLPLLALFNLVKQHSANTYNWWSSVFLFLLIIVFIYQTGAWPYIGFNWRYIIVLVVGLFRFTDIQKKDKIQSPGYKFEALWTICHYYHFCFVIHLHEY
ncbi:MAG: hypothetical protein V9F05_07370 [Chitinophagaceae bacterium]